MEDIEEYEIKMKGDKMAKGGEAHRLDSIFEDGGEIAEGNLEMAMSNVKAIGHHAQELKSLLNEDTSIEAWVVAKLERAETDLSDVTHYIDGLKGEEVESDTYFGRGGLTKEETLKVAEKYAEALSKSENKKVTVNTRTLEEDSFDLDMDGIEYDGGSYNIYDNGDVKNMAISGSPVYGKATYTVDEILRNQYSGWTKMAKGGGFNQYGEPYGYEESESDSVYEIHHKPEMNANNPYLIWDKIDGVYIAEFPNNQRALHFIENKKYGYAKGGGIYSSENLYIVKVFDGKSGELLDMSRRVWAKNLSQAQKMAIEDFEYDMKAKYGDHLRFKVEEAPSMMAKGGKLSKKDFFKKYEENEDENMHTENVVLLAENYGTESDISDAKTILAKHESIGHLPTSLRQERDALHDKLWSKYVQSREDGGMMAKGTYIASQGETERAKKVWQNMSYDERMKFLKKQYRHDEDVLVKRLELESKKNWDDLAVGIQMDFEKNLFFYEQGGYMADGGRIANDKQKFGLKILKSLKGFNDGQTLNGVLELLGYSQYRFGKYATESQVNEVKNQLDILIKMGYVEESGIGYKITKEGSNFLNMFDYGSYEQGGYMADGGETQVFEKFMKSQIDYIISLKLITQKKKVINTLLSNMNDYVGDDIQKKITTDNLKYALTQKTASAINNVLKISLNALKSGEQMAKGGRLSRKQKQLDLNKNGKLDSQDFKMLRAGRKNARKK
jgi:hypothetical protein